MTGTFEGHHFNTAGSGLNSQSVVDAVTGYVRAEAQFGSYEMELAYTDTLEHDCYAAAATLLHAAKEDIALFDSATRAWATAVQAVPFSQGDRVLITPYEYAGNILALQPAIAKYNLSLEVIPTDGKGDLDLDWLQRSIDDRVKLVSVTHIPSNCGIIQPIADVSKIIEQADPRPFYFVDACQSFGHVPINVRTVSCDVLTAAGRKFACGPRGTALAYFSPTFRQTAPAQITDLHVSEIHKLDCIVQRDNSAKRYELLEKANAAFVGLEVALRERLACQKDASPIFHQLSDMVADQPGLKRLAPGSHHAGIVTFYSAHIPAETIVSRLRERRINTWVVNGRHTPLHMNAVGLERAVRTSVDVHNTPDDIAALQEALSEIVTKTSVIKPASPHLSNQKEPTS